MVDIDLKKINDRIKKLDIFLQKAEERLFDVQSAATSDLHLLKEDYEVARKTQLELAEFLRKYLVQSGGDSDEVLELARRLRSLKGDQLEKVRSAVEGVVETRQ